MAVPDFAHESRFDLDAALPLLLDQADGVLHWADRLKHQSYSFTLFEIGQEKIAGFQSEGVLREPGLSLVEEFEDESCYAILRRDWPRLYDKSLVEIII